jgi:hypothetical protein
MALAERGWSWRSLSSICGLPADQAGCTGEDGQQGVRGATTEGSPGEDWCSGLQRCTDQRHVEEWTRSGWAWLRRRLEQGSGAALPVREKAAGADGWVHDASSLQVNE